MKKIVLILIVAFLVSLNLGVIAQPPPPPSDPGGFGGGGNLPVGGSAPIGNGIIFLIGFAGLYGGKKIFKARREFDKFDKEEE